MSRARRRSGRSPFAVGLFALVVICILTYLGFTKSIPFTRGYQVQAVFESANGIRPSSPVRIAGVEVGKVVAVESQDGTDNAVVTLEIKDQGRPIHADATAKIRPRIFLEGNFFVDLQPGTPGAEELGDGDTLAVTRTATPVQLDQVLTALQSDSRADLQEVIEGLGTAWSSEPTAEQDRNNHPSTRGETAAESFNDAYDDIGPAEKAQSIVNEALLGTEPEQDLSRLIGGLGRTAAGLARSETQLQDLVVNFNTTMAAFASQEGALSAAIRELPTTLANANAAFTSLNAAFPSTRAFAREILPGVRETPETIRVSFPWMDQARALLSPDELQGLTADLAPATRDLARFTEASTELLPETDRASKCARDVILPTGDVVVLDEFQTGRENYKDFFYAMVGLAAEAQNFDGNGQYVRFQTGGGSQTVTLGQSNFGTGPQFGALPTPTLGNRPAYTGKRPPFRTDRPCHTQTPPDLNGPAAALGAPLNNPNRAATATATSRELQRLRSKLEPFETGGER